jgi:hypothetical protein
MKFIKFYYLFTKLTFLHYLPNNIISNILAYTVIHLYYKTIIGKRSSIHTGAFFMKVTW